MEFVEMEKREFERLFQFKVEEGTRVYALKEEGILGYGFIHSKGKNPIHVYVSPKYRGNGYGTVLFGNLLEVIQKQNGLEMQDKKEISFVITKEERQIHRIIKKYGGILVFEDGKSASYVLPLEREFFL